MKKQIVILILILVTSLSVLSKKIDVRLAL